MSLALLAAVWPVLQGWVFWAWRAVVGAGLALLLLLGGAAPADGGSGNVVRMVVLGVVSPGATFGLVRHLRGIEGVRDVTFDLEHGVATMRVASGVVVSDEALREAVRSASYTPGEIRRGSDGP